MSPWPNGTLSPSLPSASAFAILDVDVRDPVVVLLDEVHRIAEIARDVVADVEVRAVVFRGGERFLEHRLRRLRVAVVADHHGVLVGELPTRFTPSTSSSHEIARAPAAFASANA